jgi:hypothetical protein
MTTNLDGIYVSDDRWFQRAVFYEVSVRRKKK